MAVQFDSIVVLEDWISEHFLTTDAKGASFGNEVASLVKSWKEDAAAGHESPLTRFSANRTALVQELSAIPAAEDSTRADRDEAARSAHAALREVLGYDMPSSAGSSIPVAFSRGNSTLLVEAWRRDDVLLLESSAADSVEDIFSAESSALGRVSLDDKPYTEPTGKLISELYVSDEAPRFIVVCAGAWIAVTERERWPEGRWLAVNALLVAERNNTKAGQEVQRALAITAAESFTRRADASVWWDSVLEKSKLHTVGVSEDLRDGIRRSIEIIANDVLQRRKEAGFSSSGVDGNELARQSLRYLYRILFLLFAEASPEMGVLPAGDENYSEGYGLDRLRDLILNPVISEKASRGTHLYESLQRLFTLVNEGHGTHSENDLGRAPGLHFANLSADLFRPEATFLIDDAGLGNHAVQQVLEYLLLSREQKGKDRGFISYAELGVNQLGAVYEGLMSYTGFIANEDLYEVAKNGDSSKGSWVVPVTKSADYLDSDFVRNVDPETGQPQRVLHRAGQFVYRLAGRERQQSASYYSPEVLTKFVVSQALEELRAEGRIQNSEDVLSLTVCEPALGSGAFAVEAVRQLAEEYLRLRQTELGEEIDPEQIPLERQRVKAYIALHNVYGVDLNSTAVELAEVSLWLDTMVKDLKAPWFGLHLRRGNSLIGARRAVYTEASVTNGTDWLKETPKSLGLTSLAEAMGRGKLDPELGDRIHHFLLPATGWGVAEEIKDLRGLAGERQAALKEWRKSIKKALAGSDVRRLQALTRRADRLWQFALLRLQIADSEIRREIPLWGRNSPQEHALVVTREQIEEVLNDPNSSYRRLRLVMDAWAALWFWPLTNAQTEVDGENVKPPSIDRWLDALEAILGKEYSLPQNKFPQDGLDAQLDWEGLGRAEMLDFGFAAVQPMERILPQHSWIRVCQDVALDQGFFHWELDFAPVFARGGFDLQVGNPPWVRPRTDNAALLAEYDPWWQLAHKPKQADQRTRREITLSDCRSADFFVSGTSDVVVLSDFLNSSSEYPLLKGQQPDLYRAFMERTWHNASPQGIVSLIHPESHFTEKKAAPLRAEAYRRLRRHWQFINEAHLFEIHHLVTYGIHVYGSSRPQPEFIMAASLYHPDTVERSFKHDGSGEIPGMKDSSDNWDMRPHAERLIRVTEETLRAWRSILDTEETPVSEARMVYPINRLSMDVLTKLAAAPRIRELNLHYSRGWDETIDRKKGYFEVGSAIADSWNDVILQGPHFSVANPFAKIPNPTMKNNRDWTEVDLESLPRDFIPRTSFQPHGPQDQYIQAQTHWNFADGKRVNSINVPRIVWRSMAARTGYRTLIPSIIPRGPYHVHAVRSLATADGSALLKIAGFLSSIPVDFWVKTSVGSEISSSFIDQLPIIQSHPLDIDLMERVAKLNFVLSEKYEDEDFRNFLKISPILRSEQRRMALIEIDALVALMLGLTADELVGIYKTQFPVMQKYERADQYDLNGRKVPKPVVDEYKNAIQKMDDPTDVELSRSARTWVHPQSNAEYIFELPFRTLDRENDMRAAYTHFEKILAERNSAAELGINNA